MPRGREPAIQGQALEVLRTLVSTMRGATMIELCAALQERTGIKVSTVTLHDTLKRAGLQRIKPRECSSAAVEPKPRRYGYTAQHRAAATASADHYPSSLTEAEWALVADLFESPAGGRGRPPTHARRAMVDACCYVVRTGCAWTMLPKSFPPWLTVHKAFSRWVAQGKFELMHARLAQQWRQRVGKLAQPSAVVIDSQSTRISPQGGDSGFDAGKKVKGRKRHIAVDTLGLLLAVSVTAASVQDRDGADTLVANACARHPQLQRLYADHAYGGQCAQRIEQQYGLVVEIVRRPSRRGEWNDPQASLWPEPTAFTVLPKRWIVERTHAWLERSRRLVMHHDRSTRNASGWPWLAQARMLLRRLAPRI